MCHPPGSRPPELPHALRPISGGAGGSDVVLTSRDGARFRAYLAPALRGDAAVVVAPDVRGLHPFYEELAERFGEAGVHAIAFDYFGRTAGVDRRGDDFPFRDHVPLTRPETIQADVAASAAHLRSVTGAARVFALGFCMGGRVAFTASADQPDLSGVIGFYGRLSALPGEKGTSPAERAPEMRAPVLALMGGADPGIPVAEVRAFAQALRAAGVRHHVEVYDGAPHSFFDRTFADHRATCDDAWRRVLGFITRGEPSAQL